MGLLILKNLDNKVSNGSFERKTPEFLSPFPFPYFNSIFYSFFGEKVCCLIFGKFLEVDILSGFDARARVTARGKRGRYII